MVAMHLLELTATIQAAPPLKTTIQTASIGIPDTLFLMLLALVVFGPRRLPEIGRQIGKLMYEFRKVSNDFKFQMEEELRASEEADRLAKLRTNVAAASQPVIEASSPVTESTPLELTSSVDQAASGVHASEPIPDSAPSVEGEVRGIPQIQPPVTGEQIAAQRPFRGRIAEPASTTGDEVSAPSAEPNLNADAHHATAQEAQNG